MRPDPIFVHLAELVEFHEPQFLILASPYLAPQFSDLLFVRSGLTAPQSAQLGKDDFRLFQYAVNRPPNHIFKRVSPNVAGTTVAWSRGSGECAAASVIPVVAIQRSSDKLRVTQPAYDLAGEQIRGEGLART